MKAYKKQKIRDINNNRKYMKPYLETLPVRSDKDNLFADTVLFTSVVSKEMKV